MAKTGREKFAKIKPVINFLVKVNSVLPQAVNNFLFNFFRNTNGNIGLLIRYIILKNLAKSCGDNVSIQPGVFLFNLKNISFGNNVSIHPMCYIDGYGGISIGNDVSIAHSTSILTKNHDWEDMTTAIKYNEEKVIPVTIHDDVWIACGVRILAGVTINTRSVVAAGAVVNKNIDANTIVGGIPAKEIKKIPSIIPVALM